MNWIPQLNDALESILSSVTARSPHLPTLNATAYRNLVQQAEREPSAAIDAERYWIDLPDNAADAISALGCHPVLESFFANVDHSGKVRIAGLNSSKEWTQTDGLTRYLLIQLMRGALASGSHSVSIERLDRFLAIATEDLPGYEATFVGGLRLGQTWRIADGVSAMSYSHFKDQLPRAAVTMYDGLLSERITPQSPLFVLLRKCEWGPALAVGDWEEPRVRFHCQIDALSIVDSLALAVGRPLPIVGQSMRAERWIYQWLGSWSDIGMFHLRRGIDIASGYHDVEVPPQQLNRFADLFSAQVAIAKQHQNRVGLAVSRLASALGRSGTLAEEDAILDVAIALEVLYRPPGPIAETLSSRAAWFLGNDIDERYDIRKTIKGFYRLRSELAHGKNLGSDRPESKAAFDIARRTLLRYSTDGTIPGDDDWNRIVMGERQSRRRR